MELFYYICFFASLVFLCLYAFFWHKHFSVVFTLIFAFVPIANFGSLCQINSQNIREAILGIKLTYIGSSYLILLVLFAIFDLCKFNQKRWMRFTLVAITTAVFLTTLTIGINPFFYEGVEMHEVNGHFSLIKHYGPLHTFYFIHIASYLIISIGATILSIKKNKDASNKILSLLLLCEFSTVLLFFGGRLLGNGVDLLPLSYIIDEIILLFIIIEFGTFIHI